MLRAVCQSALGHNSMSMARALTVVRPAAVVRSFSSTRVVAHRGTSAARASRRAASSAARITSTATPAPQAPARSATAGFSSSAVIAALGLVRGSTAAPCISEFKKHNGYKVWQHFNKGAGFSLAPALSLAAQSYGTQQGLCKACPHSSSCPAFAAYEAGQVDNQQRDAMLTLLDDLAARFPGLQLEAPVTQTQMNSRSKQAPEISVRVAFRCLADVAADSAFNPDMSMHDDRWLAPQMLEHLGQELTNTTSARRLLKQSTGRDLKGSGLHVDHLIPGAKGGRSTVVNFYLLEACVNQSLGASISTYKVECVGWTRDFMALLEQCLYLENEERKQLANAIPVGAVGSPSRQLAAC